MRLRPVFILIIFILSTVFTAVSANTIRLLKDSPMGAMSDEDLSLFKQSVQDALNQTPDKKTLKWQNDKTGSNGILRPLHTYDENGMKCRRLQIRNNVKNISATTRFNFCKYADGLWKIAPPRKKKKK